MEKNRERTYLIFLNYLIIATLFVEITISEINILGNKALVPEWFIEATIILMWIYFLWRFIGKNEISFKEPYSQSEVYQQRFNKYARPALLSQLNSIGLSPKELVDAGPFRSPSEGKYRVEVHFINNEGSKKMDHVIFPKKKFLWVRVRAYIDYILHDGKFSETVFPCLMSIVTAISMLISLILWMRS